MSHTCTGPWTRYGPLGLTTTFTPEGAGGGALGEGLAAGCTRRNCSAPLGHLAIAARRSSGDAFSGRIHGRALGSNTLGRPRTHSSEWMHTSPSNETTTSPALYSF